ncbi:NADH dehydrogenase [ubiquinone] 1 alpha subcomplex subunit 6-like [Plutella xylostella]|uniref:NADH dehydrogenase [ubiquinone] 1 alpha subcomplex subunit 6-like n=1 Tax=Plutella xylostella TaxID=51655 RepID=UPI0005D0953F|nr:NADH dehydrogenase [ubiquinone] 1 alpha subcomplex subunit 6-like [Plutella xylostella]
MATCSSIKSTTKQVRPLLSLSFNEARQRSIGLYRAWYRYIPYLLLYCDINKSHQQCRDKLREKFYKNACVTDTRVVDMLVIKGYMELKEVTHNWMQKGRIMAHWNPTHEPKPKEFIAKFLRGLD